MRDGTTVVARRGASTGSGDTFLRFREVSLSRESDSEPELESEPDGEPDSSSETSSSGCLLLPAGSGLVVRTTIVFAVWDLLS